MRKIILTFVVFIPFYCMAQKSVVRELDMNLEGFKNPYKVD
jgi:hypothetical protein